MLSAYDVRGAVLEVASRWVGLGHIGSLPVYEQQLVALEALQIFAPLAHALGLGALAAEMEDTAFQVGAGGAAGCLQRGWFGSRGLCLQQSVQRQQRSRSAGQVAAGSKASLMLCPAPGPVPPPPGAVPPVVRLHGRLDALAVGARPRGAR